MIKLADAAPEARKVARQAFVPAMHILLDQLRGIVSAEKVTLG